MIHARRSLWRWIDGEPLRVLPVIVLFALAVETAWLGTHPPGPDSGETSHWWPLIVNVARGQGYSACFPDYFPFCGPANSITAAREPVPVLLFAAVARLTRESLLAAVMIEIALGVATLTGVYLLARRLAGARSAAVAALLWSLYLPALEMTLQVSGGLAATSCVVWGLLVVDRARRHDHARDWLVAGCCLGVGGLCRSAVMVLAPAIGLVEGTRTGHARRAAWRRVALLGSAFLLTLSPWIVRNDLVLGGPVLGTTLSGYNLYRHNSLLPSGNYLRVVAGSESERAIRDLLARRRDLKGTENEAEMNAVYTREAVEIIERWPLRYALLSLYRFLPLWLNWGFREAYGVRPRLPDFLLAGEQFILLLGAIAGLRRLGGEARPIGACVAAFSLAHMLVTSQLRYMVPVMPLVMVLAAAALSGPPASAPGRPRPGGPPG